MANTKLQTQRLHEILAERLEDMILNGIFAPGEMLPSARALAEEYGVSQTVVRDAIRHLNGKGLVQVRQGVGTSVTESAHAGTIESFRLALRRQCVSCAQVRELRTILETQIAGLAAERRTEQDLQRMRNILDHYGQVAASAPWEETFRWHIRFHLAVITAAHNQAIAALMEPLTQLFMGGAEPEEPGEPAVLTYQQHEFIFERIQASDADGARAAL
ncbi:MAG: FadR family transcriptional regulator [Chloroflexi bacterium]|nr:FadR family transcriptional regulator [Chloroflexota bacterium]